MSEANRKDFPSAKEVQRIMGEAVQDALLMHKRLRNPIATFKDGRVVIVPPDEIPVEDDGRALKLNPF